MRLVELGNGTAEEAHAMRAMFVARKEVFIDLLGWDVPVLEGRFEVDNFDTVSARYLILMGEDGRHHASTRLLPTTAPHILNSLFLNLCAEVPPAGPNVVEVTRFCLDRHQRGYERLMARNMLVSALVDYALSHGIATYTGVAEQSWFDQIKTFGWACNALGRTRRYGSQNLVALRIDIDAGTVPAMVDAGIYSDPMLATEAAPTQVAA